MFLAAVSFDCLALGRHYTNAVSDVKTGDKSRGGVARTPPGLRSWRDGLPRGNKRTALAAAEVFLDLNDFRLAASDARLVELVLGVAEGKVSKDETTAFFRKRCRRVFKV